MQPHPARSTRSWIVLAQHDFVIHAFPGREAEAAHRSAEAIALASGHPVRIYAVEVPPDGRPPEPGIPVPAAAGWNTLEEESA